LWDIKNLTTPIQFSTIEGHSDNVNSIAFSPDGKTLASGSDDDTISFDNTTIIWDISDPTTPSQLVTLEGSGRLVDINSVVFSPSGKILTTGNDDGTITLWDLDPTSWVKKACQRVGRNFTRAEWSQYFPGEEYRKTCEQWPLEPEPN
jgi:WD40 repeat protein